MSAILVTYTDAGQSQQPAATCSHQSIARRRPKAIALMPRSIQAMSIMPCLRSATGEPTPSGGHGIICRELTLINWIPCGQPMPPPRLPTCLSERQVLVRSTRMTAEESAEAGRRGAWLEPAAACLSTGPIASLALAVHACWRQGLREDVLVLYIHTAARRMTAVLRRGRGRPVSGYGCWLHAPKAAAVNCGDALHP